MDKKQLQKVAQHLADKFGHEIVRDGDWWFGTDTNDFNIHNNGRDDGLFTVNVYPYSAHGTDYSQWITLEPLSIKVSA